MKLAISLAAISIFAFSSEAFAQQRDGKKSLKRVQAKRTLADKKPTLIERDQRSNERLLKMRKRLLRIRQAKRDHKITDMRKDRAQDGKQNVRQLRDQKSDHKNKRMRRAHALRGLGQDKARPHRGHGHAGKKATTDRKPHRSIKNSRKDRGIQRDSRASAIRKTKSAKSARPQQRNRKPVGRARGGGRR